MTSPSWDEDQSTRLVFDQLLQTTRNAGSCPEIDFRLPWPKWQFLCHAAEQHGIVLQRSFPFLAQIRGHDDQRLREYATAMETAAPWPVEL